MVLTALTMKMVLIALDVLTVLTALTVFLGLCVPGMRYQC